MDRKGVLPERSARDTGEALCCLVAHYRRYRRWGTAIVSRVFDPVTNEQLAPVEANAELEAESLARWFEGEQESGSC